jgi:hypothetical protein
VLVIVGIAVGGESVGKGLGVGVSVGLARIGEQEVKRKIPRRQIKL